MRLLDFDLQAIGPVSLRFVDEKGAFFRDCRDPGASLDDLPEDMHFVSIDGVRYFKTDRTAKKLTAKSIIRKHWSKERREALDALRARKVNHG